MSEKSFQADYLKYSFGLVAALVLVYISYIATVTHWLSGRRLALLILAAAGGQLIIQLIVFLHVGREARPRFTLWSILYVGALLVVFVGCSLWIMANMNYNMGMTPEQMHEYMIDQNKKGF